MNLDQEEKLIIEQVQNARHNVVLCQRKISELKLEQSYLETQAAIAERALIDYLEGNGITKTANVTLSYRKSVVVSCEVDALPEKYIRTKKEMNKILINEDVKNGVLAPENTNWVKVEIMPSLTVKGVK